MAVRTWQVTADVVFPNHLPVDVDDQGNPRFPDRIEPQSRIPTDYREIAGASVFVRESDDQQRIPEIRDDLRYAVGELVVRFESQAEEPMAATNDAMPVLDRVLESLSFQMQTALRIYAVGAIELTGSPQVGE